MLGKEQTESLGFFKGQTLWLAFYSAVCIAVFWRPLEDWFRLGLSADTDSYILVMPFVSLGLLWMFRTWNFQVTRGSSRMFAMFCSVGAMIYFLRSHLSNSLSSRSAVELSILSLCCFIFAGFALIYGEKALRAGQFPLLLLLLAVPLPESLLDRLIWWLQQGSADVTLWTFHLTGTPVFRQGLLMTVPGVTIEIAKECSGIRSALAVLIVCLLAGYLLLSTLRARVALIACALPILVLKNGIRIVTLTLLAVHVDKGFLSGRLHRDGGGLFFLLGLLLLVPILFWLQKLERRRVWDWSAPEERLKPDLNQPTIH